MICRRFVTKTLMSRRRPTGAPTLCNNFQQSQSFLSSAAQSPPSSESMESTSEELDDSFLVLDLPRKFEIAEDEMKKNYRKLMADFHPDRNAGRSEEEREEAERISTQVTSAYQLLKNPHTRATHLLELLGSPLDETSKGNLVGAEFLMEIMELREDINHTPSTNLEPIYTETKQRIESLCKDLSEAFEENDLGNAMELSAKLQYWYRVEETIYEKMEDE